MRAIIQKAVVIITVLMTGAVQAALVGLNTFSNEYVGANATATITPTAGGFSNIYNTVASGNSFLIASAGLSAGPATLSVGQSAVLSFVYNAKVSTLDLGFRWGLDFGDMVIQMRADTASAAGVYATTFLRESYVTANGSLTNALGSINSDKALADAPSSNYWFKTGVSNVAITTTVTRVAANTYTIDVVWGGNTYSSTNTNFAADGTIDSVFFGNGKDSGGGVATGDNFTISNISLNVIPEPATVSMLGIGAVALMMFRRNRRA